MSDRDAIDANRDYLRQLKHELTGQLSRADIKDMTPEQIDQAYQGGKFNALLGMPQEDAELIDRARDGGIDMNDVRRLRALGQHELIADAYHANRIITKEN